MQVIKRNGSLEEFNTDKILKMLNWSCEGLQNVQPIEILMQAKMKLHDGVKTTKVQEALIRSAVDLISIKALDYQIVASRLLSLHTRKQIFGKFNDNDLPHIREILIKNTDLGFYDPQLLTKFNDEELDFINSKIDHSLDSKMVYAQYKKIIDSYVMRNRKTKYVYETPQFAFMIISMAFSNTVDEVIKNYELLAREQSTSYATPILAGTRTTTKQFASCVLIDINDSVESMGASNYAILRFISRKAGLGINFGRWRGFGSSIRNGEVVHTGKIPILRAVQNLVNGFSQGGIRKGSATTFYPLWDSEFEELIVLKNDKGTEDNRLKGLDYAVQIDGYLLKKMLQNEKISFFSTSDVPELYEAFGTDKFPELYEKYVADKTIPRREMDGIEVFSIIADERQDTGRVYIMFIDNVNKHSRFTDKIYQSNLCFTGDTLVRLSDGTNERIDVLADKSKGVNKFDVPSAYTTDETIFWIGEDSKAVAFKTGTKKVIEVTLNNGDTFRCTENHKLALSIGGGYVEAKDSKGCYLEYYDEYDSDDVYVDSIKYLDELVDVYDLNVEKNHNFYITTNKDLERGILVHNCMEVVEPTTPIEHIDDEDGEIALCNLGAVNLGVVYGKDTFKDLREPSHTLVRNVDSIISIQEYPVAGASKQAKRRSLGIGVTNFAYWMAKNGLKYDDPKALPIIDELFEHFQFYLIEGSMLLAKELGKCEYFHKTKWANGYMPIDDQNVNARNLVGNRSYTLDWEWLRGEVKKYGLRNSVLSALMPVESSSLVTNSTNGIEPPRDLLVKKGNITSGFIPQAVPQALELADDYTLAWDITSNSCINKIVGVMQMWVDQAISVNHYYNPSLYPNNMIPKKVIMGDIVEFYKYGGKNLYYANTNDSSIHNEDADCESCKV